MIHAQLALGRKLTKKTFLDSRFIGRAELQLFVIPFKRAKMITTILNLAKSKKTMGHARDYLKGHLVKQK